MVGSFSPLGNYDINFETGRMLWVGRLHAANYFTIEQINPLNWTLQAVATSTTTNYQTVHHYYIASFLYWPFLVNNSVEFLAELVKNSKWPPLSFELFMELNWTENTCWSDIKCQNQPDKKGGEEVKRKIMSLTSHYPDEAQHIWPDFRPGSRLTNIPFQAMQNTFDVNV